jgi:hypothetical protein
VLNAKGGEIEAKANGLANHLWISKIVELESLCLIKTLLLQKLYSYGGEFWLWEKWGVEFVTFDQSYSWKISWFVKTNVFWYRDRKKNLSCDPSGGKSDPNMPNPMWVKLVFNLHSLASLKIVVAFWVAFNVLA